MPRAKKPTKRPARKPVKRVRPPKPVKPVVPGRVKPRMLTAFWRKKHQESRHRYKAMYRPGWLPEGRTIKGITYKVGNIKDGPRRCENCVSLVVVHDQKIGSYPWGEKRRKVKKLICSMGVFQPRLTWVCDYWEAKDDKAMRLAMDYDDTLKQRHRFLGK